MKFFAKRKLNKQLEQLSERSVINPKKIKRLIFIHDVDLDITESQFEEFCDIFSNSYDLIEYVNYSENKKMLDGKPRPHLHGKSIDWYGRFIDNELNYVMSQKYDLLVHFVSNISIPLQLFSSKLDASFRIGPFSLDKRLNDLVVSEKLDFSFFLSDVKKYYKKIKPNEFF